MTPGRGVQLAVRAPEGVEEIDAALPAEELVVELLEEEHGTAQRCRVLAKPRSRRAGEAAEPEDGRTDPRLGGDQREAQDGAHREPPVADDRILEAELLDQLVEDETPVGHHLVRHRVVAGPGL